jgi:hypothetical protein
MRLAQALLPIATLLLAASSLRADEGMWTFDNIPTAKMKAKYGFEPDAAWLNRLQKGTLRFPGGTGSFVSADGLVITNHHVGRSSIQQVSTGKADYIKDGFTAAGRDQELRIPGLELMMLVASENVTAQVNGAVKPGSPEAEALKARQNQLSILKAAQEKATGLTCEAVTLYQGGEYWIYRYQKFTDVRLVAAPELQVASFGGDADNYTYPRWNLDFAMFRVYENNKPYRPEAFLPFASQPLRIGDLTLISGHPGTTNRKDTLAQMRYAKDVFIPFRLRSMERQRAALVAFAATSEEARRISSDAIYGIDNGHKRFSGQLAGLMKPQSLRQVEEGEQALQAAVAKDPQLKASAGQSWARISQAVEAQKTLLTENLMIDTRGSALLGFALTLERMPVEVAKPSDQRLQEFTDGALKATQSRLTNPRPIPKNLDEARLAAGLSEAQDLLGKEHPFVKAMLAGQTPAQVAKAALDGTRLQDPAFRKQLMDGGAPALAACQDPLIVLARKLDPLNRQIRKRWEDQVQSVLTEHGGRIADARFKAFGKSQYPDATFTLRLSYGPVATYDTGSATKAQPFTTFLGLFDRHEGWGGNTVAAEGGAWTLPQRWLDRKDRLALATPFNFIYACDTVGGNSGSPVVNTKGEFVGINFDSVYEGQGGYYVYDDATKRAVAADARAILESLRKVLDAKWVADELTAR